MEPIPLGEAAGAAADLVGRDSRSAVSVVKRACERCCEKEGGLNRGGGKVSTVGDETSDAGDDSVLFFLAEVCVVGAAAAAFSNLGDVMDRGEGVD